MAMTPTAAEDGEGPANVSGTGKAVDDFLASASGWSGILASGPQHSEQEKADGPQPSVNRATIEAAQKWAKSGLDALRNSQRSGGDRNEGATSAKALLAGAPAPVSGWGPDADEDQGLKSSPGRREEALKLTGFSFSAVFQSGLADTKACPDWPAEDQHRDLLARARLALNLPSMTQREAGQAQERGAWEGAAASCSNNGVPEQTVATWGAGGQPVAQVKVERDAPTHAPYAPFSFGGAPVDTSLGAPQSHPGLHAEGLQGPLRQGGFKEREVSCLCGASQPTSATPASASFNVGSHSTSGAGSLDLRERRRPESLRPSQSWDGRGGSSAPAVDHPVPLYAQPPPSLLRCPSPPASTAQPVPFILPRAGAFQPIKASGSGEHASTWAGEHSSHAQAPFSPATGTRQEYDTHAQLSLGSATTTGQEHVMHAHAGTGPLHDTTRAASPGPGPGSGLPGLPLPSVPLPALYQKPSVPPSPQHEPLTVPVPALYKHATSPSQEGEPQAAPRPGGLEERLKRLTEDISQLSKAGAEGHPLKRIRTDSPTSSAEEGAHGAPHIPSPASPVGCPSPLLPRWAPAPTSPIPTSPDAPGLMGGRKRGWAAKCAKDPLRYFDDQFCKNCKRLRRTSPEIRSMLVQLSKEAKESSQAGMQVGDEDPRRALLEQLVPGRCSCGQASSRKEAAAASAVVLQLVKLEASGGSNGSGAAAAYEPKLDGMSWRKYGDKSGSPGEKGGGCDAINLARGRLYYKCTRCSKATAGKGTEECGGKAAKKMVQPIHGVPGLFLLRYEGVHMHPVEQGLSLAAAQDDASGVHLQQMAMHAEGVLWQFDLTVDVTGNGISSMPSVADIEGSFMLSCAAELEPAVDHRDVFSYIKAALSGVNIVKKHP